MVDERSGSVREYLLAMVYLIAEAGEVRSMPIALPPSGNVILPRGDRHVSQVWRHKQLAHALVKGYASIILSVRVYRRPA